MKTKKMPRFYKDVEQKLAQAVKDNKCIFSGIVAYHKSGEKQIDQYYRFATELQHGTMTDCLWEPDGSHCSSIVIEKEIHLDLKRSFLKRPVFFVRNHLDYSRTIPNSGGRVHKKPFKRFSDALKLAEQHFADALASGKWVDVKDVKRV